MSRSNKVQEIVLSEEHKTLRLVLFVLVLAVALTAFTYGIYHLVRKDSGWRTVTVKPAEVGGTCAHEFTFQYKLGSGGAAEYKQVQQVYSDACTYMYEVFSLEPSVLVQGNLYQVNATPGQDVQVDPFLYQTLQQVEKSGTRALYLAPVYEYYKSLFQCSDDASAQLVDPAFDADAAEDIRNLCAFINDPEAIRLEFPAENTVRLEVSDAYKAYAEESGVMAYVDLYWLQDAFELDYIAEQLVDNGMTTGYITSRSGLSISLGTVGEVAQVAVEAERRLAPAAIRHAVGDLTRHLVGAVGHDVSRGEARSTLEDATLVLVCRSRAAPKKVLVKTHVMLLSSWPRGPSRRSVVVRPGAIPKPHAQCC